MFDVRYHALSLAAVFIALVVGLLLGVAIGDKELVSSARNDVRESLRRDVAEANNERDDARSRVAEEQQYSSAAYPILTGDLLTGRKIGLILLGADKDAPGLVDKALEPTGADIKVVASVRNGVDLEELASRAGGTRYDALARDPDLLGDFAKRIGIQIVTGGRLLSNARTALMSSQSGDFGDLDGIVVRRSTADPPADKREADLLDALQDGIARGLVAGGASVVGVEERGSDPSYVSWYRDRDLSSVDNLDETAGRAALVFVLNGADGAFGRRGSAQALLPPVVGGQRGG
ncbi:MAG TPA: copper transporter [Solirubrobacteraceae bacterium]|nr:copper transporter [Solirubrobacteraceae bacterium]